MEDNHLNFDIIRKESLQEIVDLLEKSDVTHDYDLANYCCYAGRMASLGNDKYLKNVSELFQREPFHGRLDEIFQTFISAEMADCQCQEEEMRGVGVTVAQDFYSFLKHFKNPPFAPRTMGLANDWFETVNALGLDPQAVDFLEDFRDTFPIPDEDCLGVVLAPISMEMRGVLERIYPPSSRVYKNRMTAPYTWEVETDWGKVSIHVREERGMCSILEVRGTDHPQISQMRWGILPLIQDKDVWVADHSWIVTETPVEQKKKNIYIKFWNGAKTVLQPIPLVSRKRSSFFGKIQAIRPVVMAAEGMGRASREFFRWKSEDGVWEIMGYVVDTEFRLVPMEETPVINHLRFLGQEVPRKDAEFFAIPKQTLFDLSETEADLDIEVFREDGQAVLLKYIPEEE